MTHFFAGFVGQDRVVNCLNS
jgi:hypothetical protein